jgi:hypothetical protein
LRRQQLWSLDWSCRREKDESCADSAHLHIGLLIEEIDHSQSPIPVINPSHHSQSPFAVINSQSSLTVINPSHHSASLTVITHNHHSQSPLIAITYSHHSKSSPHPPSHHS